MTNRKKRARQDGDIKTLGQLEQFREDYGHRCIFKAMGFTSQELALPRIAVVNSFSEGSPGHSHLRIVGVDALYAKVALQADLGAGWPTKWDDFDKI